MRNHFMTRKGRKSDLPILQRLCADTIKTVCSGDYDNQQIGVWTSGITDNRLWDEIRANQLVFVAQHADVIAGFITLDKRNYIDLLLYVHKDYQRQEIARLLLDNAESWTQTLKQTILTSNVSKTARPFFEKNDFKVLKEQIINKKGISLTDYKMIKILS